VLCGPKNYVLKVFRCRDKSLPVLPSARNISDDLLRLLAVCGWLLVFWKSLAVPAAAAETPSRCEICQGPFVESIYVAEDPVRQIKRHICLACTKSKVVCSACGLAANPKTLRKLEDGRILCEWDVKGAVLTEQEAREIFREVKRDVQRMLAHWSPLPDTNITAYLVNRDDFIKEFHRKPSAEEPEKLLGLTRSTTADGTNYDHRIYLLSGILKQQFMATCAHEYTHTWLNEHGEKTRTLNKDTVEGFCELMAWKYVAANNDKAELNRILENNYTRGQIHALIAAEQRYQFYRVIDWIHRGEDSWLDKDKLERLLALKAASDSDKPIEPLWQRAVVPTPVPDTLVLRNLSGTGNRRLALVNNQTLAKGEQARVRVGQTNVLVHCLEIRDRSVLLRIGGRTEPMELFLSSDTRKAAQ
jgi:Protein DA1